VLTFEQIKELIELVAEHRLGGVALERSGFRLQVDGLKPVEAPAPVTAQSPAPAAAPAASVAAVSESSTEEPAGGKESGETPSDVHVLTSPIVGTFYRKPNPDAEPFAEVGDRVKVGQILCIVEAMKLMNEIESDADGVVVEIYPQNAQPVEYGEPLFGIKTE